MPLIRTNKPNKVKCSLLCIGSVLFCIVPGILLVVLANNRWADWELVQATVVDKKGCGKRPKDNVQQYRVFYNFMTLDGQNITARGDTCDAALSSRRVGDTEAIMYNPDNPSEGVTPEGEKDTMQLFGFIMTGVGIGLLVLSSIFLISLFRPRNNKPTANDGDENHKENPGVQPSYEKPPPS